MAIYPHPLLILSSRKLLCFSENMAGVSHKSVYMKQREEEKPKCPKYLRQGPQLGSLEGRSSFAVAWSGPPGQRTSQNKLTPHEGQTRGLRAGSQALARGHHHGHQCG